MKALFLLFLLVGCSVQEPRATVATFPEMWRGYYDFEVPAGKMPSEHEYLPVSFKVTDKYMTIAYKDSFGVQYRSYQINQIYNSTSSQFTFKFSDAYKGPEGIQGHYSFLLDNSGNFTLRYTVVEFTDNNGDRNHDPGYTITQAYRYSKL